MKILVVEDEPGARLATTLLLESAGHVVFSAETGERALEVLDLVSFDAVVLDLTLPGGLSGADIALRMRMHTKWCVIPIIALLAGPAEDDVSMSSWPKLTGVTLRLGKPMDGNRLLMTLQRLDEAQEGG
jgi:DNA-binding response OmpR family regulator